MYLSNSSIGLVIDLNPDNLETSINVGNSALTVEHCHCSLLMLVSHSHSTMMTIMSEAEGRVTVSQPTAAR